MKLQIINKHTVFFSDISRRKVTNGYKVALNFYAPNGFCYRSRVFTDKVTAKNYLLNNPVPDFPHYWSK